MVLACCGMGALQLLMSIQDYSNRRLTMVTETGPLGTDVDEARKWNVAALAVATHVLVTFDDEDMLHGDDIPQSTLTRILESGPLEVVVRLGAEGCLVQSRSMEQARAVLARKVAPMDTTAAGDSFNGAYLAARLKGATPQEAADAGAELAAQVVQVRGAIIDDA